jgi:hypothetical protein
MNLIIVLVSWLLQAQLTVENSIESLTQTPEAIEALRASAPNDLSPSSAAVHLAAATVAARHVQVDRDLLLAIAWHESRYVTGAVGREHDGLVSCGVMTPEPTTRNARAMLTDEYLAGARHLKTWIDATGSLKAGLLGYAGGWRLIKACAAGPVLRHRDHGDDLCWTPAVFLYRARLVGRGTSPSS